MRKLIIVPCHAVNINPWPNQVGLDESWVGMFPGEGLLLTEHARSGVEHCTGHPNTALIFSGGTTKHEVSMKTEAMGYFDVAQHHGWWGHPNVSHRTLQENNATDSLQNLLFSVMLFRDWYGEWPTHTYVIGWKFKSTRYNIFNYELTRRGILTGRFEYIGINNPVGTSLIKAERNEHRLRDHMEHDPLLRDPHYQHIREKRDPFGVYHPYGNRILPELRNLISWLEGDDIATPMLSSA